MVQNLLNATILLLYESIKRVNKSFTWCSCAWGNNEEKFKTFFLPNIFSHQRHFRGSHCIFSCICWGLLELWKSSESSYIMKTLTFDQHTNSSTYLYSSGCLIQYSTTALDTAKTCARHFISFWAWKKSVLHVSCKTGTSKFSYYRPVYTFSAAVISRFLGAFSVRFGQAWAVFTLPNETRSTTKEWAQYDYLHWICLHGAW